MKLSAKLLLPILSVTFAGLLGATVFTYRMSSEALENSSASSQKMAIANAMQELDAANDFNVLNAISLAQTGLLQPFLSGDPAQRAANEDAAQARITNMRNTYSYVMLGILLPDGLCIKHTEPEFLGRDFKDETFFKTAMTGKVAIGNPFRYKDMVVYPVASPVVNADKKIIGVVFNVSRLTDTMSKRMLLGEKGYIRIATSNGLVFIDKNPQNVLKQNIGDTPWGATMLRTQKGQLDFDENGSLRVAYYDTLAGPDWLVMAVVDENEVLAPVIDLRNKSLGIALALLLIIGVLVYLSVRSVVKALYVGRDFANKVATGDFAARWHNRGKDEVAQLASQLNTAFDKVADQAQWYADILDSIPIQISVTDMDKNWLFANRELLRAINKPFADIRGKSCMTWGANALADDGLGLRGLEKGHGSGLFTQDKTAYEVTASYLKDKDGKKIGHVELLIDATEQENLKEEAAAAARRGQLKAAAMLEDVVRVILEASTNLSQSISHTSTGAHEVAQQMDNTSRAVQELQTSVDDIASNATIATSVAESTRDKATAGASVVGEMITSIGQVETKAEELKQDMDALGAHAESIGQVLTVISDIADQTNLLALNAAIEAARAGEAGRGFAVVADEVRKLAEKTMQATGEVGKAIGSIQKSARSNLTHLDEALVVVHTATNQGHDSGEALHEIVGMAADSTDKVSVIVGAAREQSVATNRIENFVSNANAIAQDVSRSMQNASAATQELTSQAHVLENLIAGMKKD